jgi:hypothetical protein
MPNPRRSSSQHEAQPHAAGSTLPPAEDLGEWPDLLVSTPESPRRLPPGRYIARAVALDSFVVFERRALAVWCDVYPDGDATDLIATLVSGATPPPLGRLPAYFRLPPRGRPLSRTSKLARVFDLMGRRPQRLDRLPINKLRRRVFMVQVDDVEKTSEKDVDGRQRQLPQANRYSVIRAFLEFLA